ncbi:MAG: sulfite exporter TauE/SafE family protein [Chloroflexota bacterium]|nr:sulfite exporter TauE/SafE family protein [Chloroflexota bacterium]
MIELPYDLTTILFIAVIILGTTALSVVAGFGLGMVAVPMLLLLLPPPLVVTIIKVVGTGTVWIALIAIWRYIQWRTIIRILPAAFAGLIVGGFILREANPAMIQLGVGVLVLISALTLIMRPILIERESLWATSLVGFLTGVMGNAAGLLAPAVVVYFTGRQFPKDVFRATTLMLFLIVELVGLPVLAVQGSVSMSDFQVALLLLPVAVAGRVLGVWLARRVSQPAFRRLTILLLFAMAALSIVSAVQDLA